MHEVTVGYCQHAIQFGEKEANRAAFDAMIADAAKADLLVLPELALTGYDFPDAESLETLAEPFESGETSQWLMGKAAEYDVNIVCGYPEACGDDFFNSCLLATADGQLHNYRKIHLFDRETTLFQPGDAPPKVYETNAGRIGLMICFDWIFPETARCLALEGAQIIAHPSNLVLPWCQRAMFARCVENRVFAITANRIGTETQAERELTFTGHSQVLNTRGETLVQAPVDTEHVGLTRIRPEQADEKHLNPHNELWPDRRPEMYGAMGLT